MRNPGAWRGLSAMALLLGLISAPLAAQLNLIQHTVLTDAQGQYIAVPGYSVPSLTDYNADGKLDLLIGEGGGTCSNLDSRGCDSTIGKVRVYLNQGTAAVPVYDSFAYVQADGVDLTWPEAGCLGLFPRMVDWTGDGLADLITGTADGKVRLYANAGSAGAPAFDAGQFIQAGLADIDVGDRATPDVVDYNADGLVDLVVGDLHGQFKVFLNEGTAGSPQLASPFAAPGSDGGDLSVASAFPVGLRRSSPCLVDVTGDGLIDLVSGNTDGQIWLYENVGTEAEPLFDVTGQAVTFDGAPIDLYGEARSRPFVGDFNADGQLDLLVGGDVGWVDLYLSPASGVPEPASLVALSVVGLALLRRRRR